MAQFIERRKEYRLPYEDKIVFTDGKRSFTGYASNCSRGGFFVTSLEPFPIETRGFLSFFLPGLTKCMTVKAKVVHIVFDRQRCEIDNGMGFMFEELTEDQRAAMNNHIQKEQDAYMELKKILVDEHPNAAEVARCLANLPSIRRHDLLALRYKVNRICTLFEPAPEAPVLRPAAKLSA